MYYNLTQFVMVLSIPLTANALDGIQQSWRSLGRTLRNFWTQHQRDVAQIRELDSLGHLSEHVLRDIGAPNSLIAGAEEVRRRSNHMRWIELEIR